MLKMLSVANLRHNALNTAKGSLLLRSLVASPSHVPTHATARYLTPTLSSRPSADGPSVSRRTTPALPSASEAKASLSSDPSRSRCSLFCFSRQAPCIIISCLRRFRSFPLHLSYIHVHPPMHTPLLLPPPLAHVLMYSSFSPPSVPCILANVSCIHGASSSLLSSPVGV
jgi:hypothetical protein